jgi:hypothetical protein
MADAGGSPASIAAVLKILQKDTRLILKDWLELLKLKPTSSDSLGESERILERPEDSASVADALHKLRVRSLEAVRETQQALRMAFNGLEAAFIRSQREKAMSLRETASGWRIGKIELELRREQAQARALYNHEVVIGWKSIAAAGDLESLVTSALAALDKYLIPARDLFTTVWAAYQDASVRTEAKEGLLPIDTFIRAVRLELLRRELESGRPDKRLKRAEFPLAALLHNLDLFRKAQAADRTPRQLLFQTGSQREQQKGLGAVLSGLDAREDYKVYCYVKAAQAAGSDA